MMPTVSNVPQTCLDRTGISLALRRLGPSAHLRGFGIDDSFEYRCARNYGEVFYTVKTTYSIKNEP